MYHTEHIITRYMIGSMAFGGIRKTFQMSNNPIYGVDKDGRPIPVLLGDKIAIVGISSILGHILTPVWLRNDINTIHRKLYNIPDTTYKNYYLTDIDLIVE